MANSTRRRVRKGTKSRGRKVAKTEALRVVIFQEGDQWVAQCLEFDIGAQANSLDELKTRFEATLNAERAESLSVHGEAFAGIEPAPDFYQEMWNKQSGEYMPPIPSTRETPYRMALVA